jgi:hypothetical protein
LLPSTGLLSLPTLFLLPTLFYIHCSFSSQYSFLTSPSKCDLQITLTGGGLHKPDVCALWACLALVQNHGKAHNNATWRKHIAPTLPMLLFFAIMQPCRHHTTWRA